MATDYGLKQTFSDKVTDSNTVQQNDLGVVRFEGNMQYVYAQVIDGAVTAGAVLCMADADDVIVSPDISGGTQIAGTIPVGVAAGTVASGSYGWVITKGIATVQTDGTAVTGSALIPSASTDGVADCIDDSTVSTNTAHLVFGFALESDSVSGTATAYICAP